MFDRLVGGGSLRRRARPVGDAEADRPGAARARRAGGDARDHRSHLVGAAGVGPGRHGHGADRARASTARDASADAGLGARADVDPAQVPGRGAGSENSARRCCWTVASGSAGCGSCSSTPEQTHLRRRDTCRPRCRGWRRARLLDRLDALGVHVPSIVVNAVGRGECRRCKRIKGAERRELEAIRETDREALLRPDDRRRARDPAAVDAGVAAALGATAWRSTDRRYHQDR